MADNLGVNPFRPLPYDPIEATKNLVYTYIVTGPDVTGEKNLLTPKDVLIIWFVKTLGNWKALATTPLADGRIYEVTHNGETKVTYVDVYQKIDHFETMEIGGNKS